MQNAEQQGYQRNVFCLYAHGSKTFSRKRACFRFLEPAPWAFTSLITEAACRRKREFPKRQSRKDPHHALPLCVAMYCWAKSEQLFSSLWMKSREKKNQSFLSLKAKCLHPLSLSCVPLSLGNETSQDTSSSPRERTYALWCLDQRRKSAHLLLTAHSSVQEVGFPSSSSYDHLKFLLF